ncbi:hypothetical protein CLOM_g14788 [Closterium sp. NIES-68]|nr:hypothetical protein CLOM_g14788 [Closterium sp. NIES-68]
MAMRRGKKDSSAATKVGQGLCGALDAEGEINTWRVQDLRHVFRRSRMCEVGLLETHLKMVTICFMWVEGPTPFHTPRCPFCNAAAFCVEHGGRRTAEERNAEMAEEQRAAEARMRAQVEEEGEGQRGAELGAELMRAAGGMEAAAADAELEESTVGVTGGPLLGGALGGALGAALGLTLGASAVGVAVEAAAVRAALELSAVEAALEASAVEAALEASAGKLQQRKNQWKQQQWQQQWHQHGKHQQWTRH